MTNPLGQHLLIDFYGCLYNAINDTKIIHEGLLTALDRTNSTLEEFSYHQVENEIIVFALASQCHIALHAYPDLGYVAVDIFSFKSALSETALMKELKYIFGAEKTKATSIQRGDFGQEKDMKPRYTSSLTPRGRVKIAGAKLKKTGAKVFHVISRKKKERLDQLP